ncbi:MAG: hypothetical protein WCC04_14785 [Terriglobales bacterium]
MKWLLQLYPAPWRERYGDEFGAVLASQRASVGMVFDVLAGAIDAHLNPQIQRSDSKPIKGEDTMTLAMFARCAAGGPRLSPSEKRIASRLSILSALAIAILYLVLTKIYREAPAVQAVLWTAILFPNFIYQQTVYLKKRLWLTQALVLAAGLSAMYLFMLAVSLIARTL